MPAGALCPAAASVPERVASGGAGTPRLGCTTAPTGCMARYGRGTPHATISCCASMRKTPTLYPASQQQRLPDSLLLPTQRQPDHCTLCKAAYRCEACLAGTLHRRLGNAADVAPQWHLPVVDVRRSDRPTVERAQLIGRTASRLAEVTGQIQASLVLKRESMEREETRPTSRDIKNYQQLCSLIPCFRIALQCALAVSERLLFLDSHQHENTAARSPYTREDSLVPLPSHKAAVKTLKLLQQSAERLHGTVQANSWSVGAEKIVLLLDKVAFALSR